MIFGTIISENKVDIVNYNNTDKLDLSDNSLPKLIIGKEFTKKLGLKISILNKSINKNTFWTFSEKERKSEFNDDIELFKKHCLDNFLKNITYHYLDPFQLKFSSTKKIFQKIKTSDGGLYYVTDKMCYIFFDNITLGVHKETIEYVGIDFNKIIKLLELNKFSTLPKDKIFNECMGMINDNNTKVLPFLYYHKKYDK
jgi:hypothetical protein